MVEWIPWLLIIIAQMPGAPEEQAEAHVQAVMDQVECEQLGADFVASRAELGPIEYRYFCAPMPDNAEIDALWERVKERNASEASQ